VELAQRAAATSYELDRVRLWRRLISVAFEDVGAADAEALVENVALATCSRTLRYYAASFEEAALAEVRLDGVQFEPSALQLYAGPMVRAVTVQPALRRLHTVSRAIEVGDCMLPRLRPRALLARTASRPLGWQKHS
jgi:hypothetical protein